MTCAVHLEPHADPRRAFAIDPEALRDANHKLEIIVTEAGMAVFAAPSSM